jgi:KaiC/GvpD/RAD55 family RecA-like ATPase
MPDFAAEYATFKSERTESADAHSDFNRLPLVWFDDTSPKLDSPYLVKGLLPRVGLSVVYGKSGTGKTFAVQDIALHIAFGLAWRGRRVNQCTVVYIAAEGGDSALNRVAAFKKAYPDQCEASGVPFVTIPAPVNLLDPDADVSAIIERVGDVEQKIGRKVGLIVIDTLSRALAGGNENGPEDMGQFVRNVDRIRADTGAHALIVHHSGKDELRGARGHSLLRAATDTEIEVSHEAESDLRTMRVTKQRDLPTDGEFAFRLRSIELGHDMDGDPVKSCVVEYVDEAGAVKRSKRVKLPASTARALELLRKLVTDHGEAAPASNHIPPGKLCVQEDEWRQACYAGQITETNTPAARQKAFARAAAVLVTAGHVGKWNDFIWVP